MTNGRAKGARGELEWAQELKSWGYEARRGQQFSGGSDSPDVVHSIPGVHFEVKRVERFLLYDAVDQARRDGAGKIPVVVHRCNSPSIGQRAKGVVTCRGEWLAVLSADDLIKLLRRAGYGPVPAA